MSVVADCLEVDTSGCWYLCGYIYIYYCIGSSGKKHPSGQFPVGKKKPLFYPRGEITNSAFLDIKIYLAVFRRYLVFYDGVCWYVVLGTAVNPVARVPHTLVGTC